MEILYDRFLNFGADPVVIIERLTALCGELLAADCTVFTSLDGNEIARWSVSPGLDWSECADALACFDSLPADDSRSIVVQHFPLAATEPSDRHTAGFNLRTCIWIKVKCDGDQVGEVHTLFGRAYESSRDLCRLLSVITTAIGAEELRRR